LSPHFLDREAALKLELKAGATAEEIRALVERAADLQSRHSFSHLAITSEEIDILVAEYRKLQKDWEKGMATEEERDEFLRALYKNDKVKEIFERFRVLLTEAHKRGLRVDLMVDYPMQDDALGYCVALKNLMELPAILQLAEFLGVDLFDATDGVIMNVPATADTKDLLEVIRLYQDGETDLKLVSRN
jgi:hypothetical protein